MLDIVLEYYQKLCFIKTNDLRHVLFFYIKYVFFVLFWIISISSKRRGSHSEVPYKIGVFKNFAKFAGKHLCRILSYIKLHPGGLQFY